MPLLLTHMLQRELVEQPTEEDLRYVLSISVLAPASDPVDEVRSGLDFTHSTIAMCPSLCLAARNYKLAVILAPDTGYFPVLVTSTWKCWSNSAL